MGNRPGHPKKDLEKLLKDVEAHGWRVSRDKGYYKAYCLCPAKHKTYVHLSPSGADYEKNKRKWFERQTCWKAS